MADGEIDPQAQAFLDGLDAMVAAVGRELDAPVVLAVEDLTHDETHRVPVVEHFRV
jgi:hypothetical protein